jgi:hypothetical protein
VIRIAFAFLTAAALSADGVSAQQSQPPACTSPEHRQFDFWIGSWEVVDSAGTVLGSNRITSTLAGCVLHEQWTGARGVRGESLNIYDRTTGRWHQSWVDSAGNLLQLDGGLENGAMVMRGQTRTADGAAQQQRITWRRLDDGSVLQLWESSADGTEWTTVFRGLYRARNPD